MKKAIKYDQEKPRVDLIDPVAILEIGKVMAHGAVKYGDRNYLSGGGFNHLRLFAAALRHLLQWRSGEDNDPESGLSHLSHAMANLAMLSETKRLGLGRDDRGDTGDD